LSGQTGSLRAVLRGQIRQLQRHGLRIVAAKVMRLCQYALNALWAIPAVLLIRALRNVYPIRLGQFITERIGHFVIDAAIHLARSQLPSRGKTLFWLPRDTANAQWARMVTRQLPVHQWVWYLIFFDHILPGRPAPSLESTNYSRDIEGAVHQTAARFEFTPGEDAVAHAWLRSKGWKEGEKFVCLLVRDPAYLAVTRTHAGEDWAYHNYRDSDIDTYVEGVRHLVEHGYWVVRMGKVMAAPLSFKHPRVIDYPFLSDQNDLMDVWLSARCHFFVSTGSGIDLIALVYERPVVFLNYLPLRLLVTFGNAMTACKRLTWDATGESLTLREHLANGFLEQGEYAAAGINIQNLIGQEILEVISEARLRADGNWTDSTDDIERRSRFWAILHEWSEFHRYHRVVHPNALPSAVWLAETQASFFQ
jgi:putative glycosyltransferase (TIGR04372 family)